MRMVPPARSPLDPGALVAGFRAATHPGGAAAPDLEAILRARYEPQALLLTETGTSSLRLGLSAAADAELVPVALPAYSCFDLATAAVGANVPVILYDLDAETLEPDLESVDRAVAGGARTFVAVHLFGHPSPIDVLRQRLGGQGALIIEDAAQGAGGMRNHRPLGTLGSLSVLSFGRGKGVTGGGGGALLANDSLGRRLLECVRMSASRSRGWRELFIAAGLWLFARPGLYRLPALAPWLRLGETTYREPGTPRPISKAGSAIAASSFLLLDEEVETRRRTAERLAAAEARGNDCRVVGVRREGSQSGWLRLPVLLRGRSRDAASAPGAASLGIARSYPLPLHRLAPLASGLVTTGDYPGAERLARELFTLPTHGGLAERDVLALEAWLRAGD